MQQHPPHADPGHESRIGIFPYLRQSNNLKRVNFIGFVRAILFLILAWSGCAFFAPCQGQQKLIDSLKTRDQGAVDTQRVHALLKLAELTYRTAPKEAIEYCRRALAYSESIQFKYGIAKAHFHHAQVMDHLASYPLAMKYALSALDQFSLNGDSLNYAKTLSNLGITAYHLGDNDKAREYEQRAIGIFKRHHSGRGIFMAQNNLAMTLEAANEREEALNLYFDNLKALDSLTNPAYKAFTYNNIGFSYLSAKNYSRALEFLDKGYRLKLSVGDEYGLTNSYNNLAATHLGLGNLKEAEQYLDTAAALCRKLGATDRYIETLRYRADLERKQKNYELAFTLRDSADALNDSLKMKDQLQLSQNLAQAYESEQQQEHIQFLEKERQTASRNGWLLVIGLCLIGVALLAALVLAIYLRRNLAMVRSQQNQILEANQELQMKNEQLEEINREKDGLIGIVAHDLRAPLNRSVALVQLIASSGPLNEEQQRFTGMINQVADNGTKLIQDLLEISAYQQGYPRPDIRTFRLQEQMELVLSGHYSHAQSKGIEIEYEPGNTLMITSDPNLMCRIVENLVSNAIKFTPAHAGCKISLRLSEEKGMARIAVKDQGPGIAAEDQKKLFRKFSRLKNRPTGGETSTGLGLAIVKILTEKLFGTIEVNSSPGKGSEFCLIFPLSPPKSEKEGV